MVMVYLQFIASSLSVWIIDKFNTWICIVPACKRLKETR